MAQPHAQLTEFDPVWDRIKTEAEAAIQEEPLLGGLVHSSLLHYNSLESALAYRISLKLASRRRGCLLGKTFALEAAAPGLRRQRFSG